MFTPPYLLQREEKRLATWQEMSGDCLKSAKVLLDQGLFRRSISSSYYAAYSAATGELVKRGVHFAHGWQNPSHDQLPALVMHNAGVQSSTRYQLRKYIQILRRARENADYRPNEAMSHSVALDCLRLANRVYKIIEETNDIHK